MTVYSQFERVKYKGDVPSLKDDERVDHAVILDIMQAKNGTFWMWLEIFGDKHEMTTLHVTDADFSEIEKLDIDK